jgi:DNA gyrase subunit A
VYTVNERLTTANIADIMQSAYIEYSMSVIVACAMPDARDGLAIQHRFKAEQVYALTSVGFMVTTGVAEIAAISAKVRIA